MSTGVVGVRSVLFEREGASIARLIWGFLRSGSGVGATGRSCMIPNEIDGWIGDKSVRSPHRTVDDVAHSEANLSLRVIRASEYLLIAPIRLQKAGFKSCVRCRECSCRLSPSGKTTVVRSPPCFERSCVGGGGLQVRDKAHPPRLKYRRSDIWN